MPITIPISIAAGLVGGGWAGLRVSVLVWVGAWSWIDVPGRGVVWIGSLWWRCFEDSVVAGHGLIREELGDVMVV